MELKLILFKLKKKQLNRFSLLKKSISSILIFSLLFSFTFRIPFMAYIDSRVFAEKSEFYNLVSIIVEENIYNNIKEKLNRYALDIQGVMENTRVVILPTPNTADVFNIASLNESLYFE
jgi:hypothetical protein